ncbi:MAG: TonB-dependent receptor [Ferruginibacter sp.]
MRTLLLLLLTAITFLSQAQQINGFVKDESGNPLNGTTVSLINASDSSLVKLAISKDEGAYHFSAVKAGNYKVLVTYIGYIPAFSPVFSYDGADAYIAELKMFKASGNMTSINIVSKKPMVEVKTDKMILNIEGTVNAVGSNALELLRKSPGILLDKDDNISLAGKNGVQVYIDGRSTPLSGQELATYLKSLQSSQIEAIELITNPSAKYDAAGNAGIINIRLIKNRSFGTNGSVNAGWNIATSAKYNAGFSLNYRNKSINIFSTYNFNYAPNEQNITFKRTVSEQLV